jgi:ubiquinone/menaquinone biosynthesis C-methylase UbiE
MQDFMSDYDLIAPFYDIEHAQFGEDVDMYRNYAEACGGNILELACGSGRVLLPLAEDGFTLTGVDTSGQMLELARQRLKQAGVAERCKLVQQDMGSLQLDETFRLAFIALGSFGHITERREQQKVLAVIRGQLSRGGMCIIDISNTDARYLEGLSGQMLHQGTWRRDDGTFLTHLMSPTSSADRHLLELTHFYDRHKQGENVTRTVVTTYLYLFERSEMELMLEQAGFVVKDVYGDYELTPYQLDSPRMICVAEAK